MLATVREESQRKSTTPEEMPSARGQGSKFGCTKSTWHKVGELLLQVDTAQVLQLLRCVIPSKHRLAEAKGQMPLSWGLAQALYSQSQGSLCLI